jgi:hypothetical protein
VSEVAGLKLIPVLSSALEVSFAQPNFSHEIIFREPIYESSKLNQNFYRGLLGEKRTFVIHVDDDFVVLQNSAALSK